MKKPMNNEETGGLGPLASLVGVWEGDKGLDTAPSPVRETAFSKYRERIVFEPTGHVDNHEQALFGLRYSRTAWRLEAENAFHEELGYWLWDAASKQVFRCFTIPRGITIIAGGTVEPDATLFELAADVGSETYGICANPFLFEEFKTVRYEVRVTVHDADTFSYWEDTQIWVKGHPEQYHHTDENLLRRIE